MRMCYFCHFHHSVMSSTFNAVYFNRREVEERQSKKNTLILAEILKMIFQHLCAIHGIVSSRLNCGLLGLISQFIIRVHIQYVRQSLFLYLLDIASEKVPVEAAQFAHENLKPVTTKETTFLPSKAGQYQSALVEIYLLLVIQCELHLPSMDVANSF